MMTLPSGPQEGTERRPHVNSFSWTAWAIIDVPQITCVMFFWKNCNIAHTKEEPPMNRRDSPQRVQIGYDLIHAPRAALGHAVRLAIIRSRSAACLGEVRRRRPQGCDGPDRRSREAHTDSVAGGQRRVAVDYSGSWHRAGGGL